MNIEPKNMLRHARSAQEAIRILESEDLKTLKPLDMGRQREVGRFFKRIRSKWGLTQEGLAGLLGRHFDDDTGQSVRQIQRIEAGEGIHNMCGAVVFFYLRLLEPIFQGDQGYMPTSALVTRTNFRQAEAVEQWEAIDRILEAWRWPDERE